jgi:DNA-binding response OmpR family regulator
MFLAMRAEVETALAAALEALDDTIEVVVLDRQMPDLSGEVVLEQLRDRRPALQVVMVGGVEPDLDIIDLAIDEYLRKPVDRPTLQAAIEWLLLRRTYTPDIERYFVRVAKLRVPEAPRSATELIGDPRYIALRTEADEYRQSTDATLGRPSDPIAAYQGFANGR